MLLGTLGLALVCALALPQAPQARPQPQPPASRAWVGELPAMPRTSALAASPAAQPEAFTGDFEALRERGQLRVAQLREATTDRALARTAETQRTLLASAARELGLSLAWLPVDDARALRQALLAGQADVALSATPLSADAVVGLATTLAVAATRYVVLSRAETPGLDRPQALDGRRVGVLASTPAWLREQLSAGGVQVKVEEFPPDTRREALVAELAAGRLDALAVSSTLFDPQCGACKAVRVAFELTEAQPLGFWVRETNPGLRAALDEALERLSTAAQDQPLYRDDLPGLERRGVLRVATVLDGTGFGLKGGRPTGMEAELLERFAREHGLRLEYLLGDTPEQMVKWLKEGRVDLIASRIAQGSVDGGAGIVLSATYAHDTPVVIARPAAAPTRVEELEGRRVALRRDSAHWTTLQSLRSGGLKVLLEEVPPGTGDDELVRGVAEGRHDLAVVSGEALPALQARQLDVRAALSLFDERRFRWSVHGDNRQLLSAVNGFFAREYRSGELQSLASRFLSTAGQQPERIGTNQISPFDDLARRHAERYGLDWRLVVAVMAEESGFDPKARSKAGARGLMQLMPATARALGFSNLGDPDQDVQAGVAYLDELRDGFDRNVPLAERTWFALAAYHLGPARVERARRVAAEQGLDPNRWSDNVERAMLEVAAKSRNGKVYRRTVTYVDSIRNRYVTYVQVADRLPLVAARATGGPNAG